MLIFLQFSQLAFFLQKADKTSWQNSQVCGIQGTDAKKKN